MSDQTPLVIIYVGGGLVQDWTAKAGTGTPRVRVIDWDREGQTGDELTDFADRIEDARDELVAFADPADAKTIANLSEAAREYRELGETGETASRYR